MTSSADHAGVFVGIQQMEYGAMASPYLAKIGPFSATGTPFSVAAGRVSYTFALKGPAVSPSCHCFTVAQQTFLALQEKGALN